MYKWANKIYMLFTDFEVHMEIYLPKVSKMRDISETEGKLIYLFLGLKRFKIRFKTGAVRKPIRKWNLVKCMYGPKKIKDHKFVRHC